MIIMFNKLITNYIISWSNNLFTITWGNIYNTVSFSSFDYILAVYYGNQNLFDFGASLKAVTTLDWRYETSLNAINRNDLFEKIIALIDQEIDSNNIPDLLTLNNIIINQTATIGNIIANTELYLPTSGSISSSLNYYGGIENFSLSFLAGYVDEVTITVKIVRIGFLVTLIIPSFIGISNGSIYINNY